MFTGLCDCFVRSYSVLTGCVDISLMGIASDFKIEPFFISLASQWNSETVTPVHFPFTRNCLFESIFFKVAINEIKSKDISRIHVTATYYW